MGGFGALRPPFQLTLSARSAAHLPEAHTCFNELVLNDYASAEALYQKLALVTALDTTRLGFALV